MANFYLFRHGETYFSKNNVPYGDEILTAPILADGIPAIEQLAVSLANTSYDLAVTSPIKRCLDTVQIIHDITKISFVPDSRLQEWMEPNEKFEELRARLADFLADMRKGKYQSIAICTHGACIAGLKHLIEDGKFESDQIHDYPPTGTLWTMSFT